MLHIVYVSNSFNFKKQVKTSQKMHLLEYLTALHKMQNIKDGTWTPALCTTDAQLAEWNKYNALLPLLSKMDFVGINIEEYLNLFRTSAVRIALSAYLPDNVDEADPATFKQIQFSVKKQVTALYSY